MNHIDLLVIGGLFILDLVLFVYVLKGLKKLSGNRKPKEASVQRQLLDAIKLSADETEKKHLIENYNTQFAKEDIKILTGKKTRLKIQAIRRLALLEDKQLYEIKKLMDDKEDAVAVRAFHTLAKLSPDHLNIDVTKKILHRAAKHRALMTSSINRLSKSSNHQMLVDLCKEEIAPWVIVSCLKCLTKVQVQDLLPVLLNAQEHSSEEVRNAANSVLNLSPVFQKFAV